jgi:hypothetical protein
MTAEACRQWRERLGALVLDRLPEAERAATEAHLEGCEACRAEAAALRPLAQLLPLADPDHIEAPTPAPPAGLEDRIAGKIAGERRAERRRRRFRFGFALSGAAAAAAVAAIALVALVSTGGSAGSEHVTFQHLPPGVQIGATLQPHSWGTEVSMRVSGIRSGTLCRVFLRRSGGSAESVGSFRYRYSNENSEQVLGGALDVSDVSAVEVKAGPRTFIQPLPTSVQAGPTSSQPTNPKETT